MNDAKHTALDPRRTISPTHDMLVAVQFMLFCGVVCELDCLDNDKRQRLERIEAYLIDRMTR